MMLFKYFQSNASAVCYVNRNSSKYLEKREKYSCYDDTKCYDANVELYA